MQTVPNTPTTPLPPVAPQAGLSDNMIEGMLAQRRDQELIGPGGEH